MLIILDSGTSGLIRRNYPEYWGILWQSSPPLPSDTHKIILLASRNQKSWNRFGPVFSITEQSTQCSGGCMYVSRQIHSCVLCNAIAHMVINAIVVYLDNPFRLCQQTIHSSPFVIVKDNFIRNWIAGSAACESGSTKLWSGQGRWDVGQYLPMYTFYVAVGHLVDTLLTQFPCPSR